jgi:hypothetical protein
MRSRVGRDVAVTLVISYHLARGLYTRYDSRSSKLRLATLILPDLDGKEVGSALGPISWLRRSDCMIQAKAWGKPLPSFRLGAPF